MVTRCQDDLGRYKGERRRPSEHLPKRPERLRSCRRVAVPSVAPRSVAEERNGNAIRIGLTLSIGPRKGERKCLRTDRRGVQATISTTYLVHSSAEREQVYDKRIEEASEQATRSCIRSSARCKTKTQDAPSEQSPSPCSTSNKKGIRLRGVRLR